MNSDVLGSSTQLRPTTPRGAARQLRWIFICLLLVTLLAALDQHRYLRDVLVDVASRLPSDTA